MVRTFSLSCRVFVSETLDGFQVFTLRRRSHFFLLFMDINIKYIHIIYRINYIHIIIHYTFKCNIYGARGSVVVKALR
jgi:hypothetical protein